MQAPIGLVQAQAGVAVAFDPAFDQQEQIGPHSLRAGVAAPDTAQRRGEQEQAQACHDQQSGDEIKFVRPDLNPQKVEAAVGQIYQHRLIGQAGATVPAQPGCQVIDAKGDGHDPPFEAAEKAIDPTRKNRRSGGVKRLVGLGCHVICSCSQRLFRAGRVPVP